MERCGLTFVEVRVAVQHPVDSKRSRSRAPGGKRVVVGDGVLAMMVGHEQVGNAAHTGLRQQPLGVIEAGLVRGRYVVQ